MHPAAAPRAGRPQPQRLPAAGHGGGRLPAGPGARIAAWRSSRRPPSPSGTDPCAAASPRRPHPTRKWAVTGSPGCRREHRPRASAGPEDSAQSRPRRPRMSPRHRRSPPGARPPPAAPQRGGASALRVGGWVQWRQRPCREARWER